MWPFKKRPQEIAEVETRSSGTGYTAQLMEARAAYISGSEGTAELTAAVQSCVSLWEGGFALADVDGTDLLTRAHMALAARALALRGECVFVIEDDRLLPCSDWDLSTRFSRPTAYRVGIPDAGGGTTRTVLAAEVLHFRHGCSMGLPYIGTSPLRRAGLTAGLLHHLEAALSEVYAHAPLGSSVVPFPESPETDLASLARGFRGYRGKVQVRESVSVTAAGGPAPATDWQPKSLSPDIEKSLAKESLDAARQAIFFAYGVLPSMTTGTAQGPLVREAQRHLAQWVLQPLAVQMADEAAGKLGSTVTIDVIRPAQAFDAGGRARAFGAMVAALAAAKEAKIDPQSVEDALKFIDWAD